MGKLITTKFVGKNGIPYKTNLEAKKIQYEDFEEKGLKTNIHKVYIYLINLGIEAHKKLK